MGHYDSCYEHEAQQEFDKEWESLTDNINRAIDKMAIDDLEFLANVAENIDDYRTFFKVLKKNIK